MKIVFLVFLLIFWESCVFSQEAVVEIQQEEGDLASNKAKIPNNIDKDGQKQEEVKEEKPTLIKDRQKKEEEVKKEVKQELTIIQYKELANKKADIIYENGDRYIGDVKNGIKHGNGQFIWVNGNKYSGTFFNDMKNGEGVLYIEKTQTISNVLYQNDVLLRETDKSIILESKPYIDNESEQIKNTDDDLKALRRIIQKEIIRNRNNK